MATKKITDMSGVQSYDVGKADSLVLTGVKAGGGSDNIYLEGNSSDYTVSVSGDATKTVLLSNAVTGQTVSIALAAPAAGAGIGENIYFLNGGAWLSYKISPTGEASVSLGKQAITETPTALAGSALTFSGNSSSHFQMYSLTVDSPSVTEGDDGTVALTYTLTLDKPAAAPLVINYWNAAGGTATANVDFVGKSTKITIPKGEQTAQVSFSVKGDTLVEPSETVNVKFNSPYLTSSVTAIGTIVDNDQPPAPTYALASSADSVDEGGSVTFSLATTNVPAGTTLSYTITGVDAADVADGALTGSFVVGTTDSVTIALSADNTTEGPETLRLALDNGGAAAAVVVNDTSLTPVPTYTLTQDVTSVDEGGNVVYTLTTTHVAEGTEVAYTITGVQAEDIVGTLTGVFTVGADGTASKTIHLKADSTTEGTETLKLALDGGLAVAADVTVNDTSVNTAPTITGAETVSGGVNTDIALPNLKFADAENNNLTVTVTATGGSVKGLTDADANKDGIQLTGTASEVTKAFADATFSGARVGAGQVTVVANDGALDSAPVTLDVTLNPTYSVTPSATTVNEGKSVTYTLATDGVKSGTSIPYTITGIDAADLSKGSLTGKFVVGKTDTVTLTLKSDTTTEGTETIKFSLDGGLATASDVTVKDTSTTPPTYTVTTSSPSVDEGSTVTYSLATTDVAAGTKLAYTITGLTSADLAKGSAALTGNFVVGTTDSITLKLASDKVTEGPETATLTLDNVKTATASVTVNDTSLTPNTAPTITGAAPASGPVNADIALADLTFADKEDNNLTVTVTATGGTVGGLVDADTAKDGIQLTGKAVDVTAAFANATFKGTAVGAGTVTVTASDGLLSSTPTTIDVSLINAAPTVSGNTAVTNAVAGNVSALPDVVFADTDAADTLTVTVTAVNGAVAGLTDADTAVDGLQLKGTPSQVSEAFKAATYTPSGVAAGTGSVGLSVSDGINAPVSAEIAVTFVAHNELPTISGNAAVATAVAGEVSALPDAMFADTDSNSVTLTVSATGGAVNGLIDADTAAAGIQIMGSPAEVTAAFAGATFTPAGAVAGTGAVDLSLSDGVNVPTTASIGVTFAANASPTIAGIAPVATAVAGSPAALPNVVFADADSSKVTVTITESNGTVAGLVDADSVAAGIQLIGTLAEVTAAFVPATFTAAGTAAGTGAVSISVSDGVSAAATDTIAVTFSAATGNELPVISGISSVATAVAGVTSDLPDVVFSDKDSASLTVTVTPTNGAVSGLVDTDAATAGIQLTGTPTQVSDAFKAATFTPAGAAAGTGTVGLSVSDGVNPAVVDAIPVTFAANALPTITGVTAVANAVASSAAALPDVVFADKDSTSLTVTVTATNGTVAGLTDADAATAGIQLTGTPAAISTAFAAATYTPTGTVAGTGKVDLSVADGVNAAVTGSIDVTFAAATTIALDSQGTDTVAASLSAAAGALAYTDSATVGNNVSISGFGADDSITFTGVTAAVLNNEIASNGSDVIITHNANGTLSQVVLVGVVTPANLVYDVASFNALPVGDLLFA